MRTSSEEKEALLDLISRVQPGTLNPKLINFLRFLPVFRCNPNASKNVTGSATGGKAGGESAAETGEFVCVAEVNRAAPVHRLPVTCTERFIDVQSDSAAKAAAVLGATFLNTTSMLREVYTSQAGDVLAGVADAISADILKNFYLYSCEDATFCDVLHDVPVCTRMQWSCVPALRPFLTRENSRAEEDLWGGLGLVSGGGVPTGGESRDTSQAWSEISRLDTGGHAAGGHVADREQEQE